MRMRYLWLALVLGLTPSAINAGQTINGVPIEAIGAGRATILPGGQVIQSIGFKATPPGASAPSYYDRAVTYNKSTVGGSIKQFAKRNAYQLALTGAILGLGWVLDEITGDIYSSPENAGTPQTTCNPRYFVSSNLAPTSYGCSVGSAIGAHITACNASYAQTAFAPGYCVMPTATSIGTFTGAYFFSQRFNSQVGHSSITIGTEAQPHTQPAIAGTPVTDLVAGDLAPELDPETLDKLATHPDTGAVKETQEVLNKMTELANELAKLANPAAPTVSAPTATGTANTTDTPQQPAMTLPPACIWFKPVCDFIEWFKPDPQPGSNDNPDWTVAGMITEQELEVQTYNSGLGSGSCPADETFTVYGTSLSYSYTPICDLAGTARIFVIIGAYMLSVFIILGIRR